MKNLKIRLDRFFEKHFPDGSKVKTIILKTFLRQREKRLFRLIAPVDSVRTKSENGYLFTKGWWSAWQDIWCRNAEGDYIPWFTYPAIDFLDKRINKEWSILEYGGGSSTLFWAEQCRDVLTVEHDQDWYNILLSKAPANVCLLHRTLDPIDNYTNNFPTKERFHIIVIDGRQRVACCQAVPDYLLPEGIIILDDSQRERYRSGIDFLREQGFRELPFSGLRHLAVKATTTSIFYRNENCLGI